MSDITVKNNKFVSAVIVSAGSSSRMGGVNKQFIEINNVPVVAHTINAFDKSDLIDEIILVTRECDFDIFATLINKYRFNKISKIVRGGETRQLSVFNGVINTADNCDYIVIHDGARPLVTENVISDTLNAAIEYGAAATGVKVKDTVKKVNSINEIVDTPDREFLRFIQTPQVFSKSLYLDAVNSVENSKNFTDDCMLIEVYGKTVKFVDGDYENIKITTPEDVELALNYLKRRMYDA